MNWQDKAENSDDFPKMGTIDLRIDYLHPGRGKYFIATGKVARAWVAASRSRT